MRTFGRIRSKNFNEKGRIIMTPEKFNYTFEGKHHECSYVVTTEDHPMVKVTTPWGPKSTQQGGLPALTVAKQMAGELARASKLKL